MYCKISIVRRAFKFVYEFRRSAEPQNQNVNEYKFKVM